MLLPLLLLGLCAQAQPHPVRSLEVRILSTMLADDAGFGEWGFAALVEVDGRRILFDTGANPDTVSRNLKALHLDLNGVDEVILSHHHLDHMAGLIPLRTEYPKSLGTAYAAKGMFYSRPTANFATGSGKQQEGNPMIAIRAAYEKSGGRVVELDGPREIHPGVWLTGPVPRKHAERNWSGSRRIRLADGTDIEDNLPEDQTLVIETTKGLVIVAGCSHAGVVNILEHARTRIRPDAPPIHAAIGGFHLFNASDETLAFTARKFREFGLQNFLGAHCTGIESVYRLRELAGLGRKSAAVGALGGGFKLETGLNPGAIAR